MNGMTPVVKTVTAWLKGLVILYGLYIVAYGHLTPGGGFAGGVIIACGLVLSNLAYGRSGRAPHAAEALDCIGAALFLALATFGMLQVLGGRFFVNFIQRYAPGAAYSLASAGVIPLANGAIALKVGASLLAVFVVMAAFRGSLVADD